MKRNRSINMKLGKDNSNRISIYIGMIVLIYLLLMSRLFYLQVIKEEKYKRLSKNNRIKMKSFEGPRGKIYDRNGVLLATNVAGYRLIYLKGRKVTDEILKELSEVTKLDEEVLRKRIKYGEIIRYTKENVLLEGIAEKDAHKLMEKLSDSEYLKIQSYSKRMYIYDSLASHILGYVKKITSKEYDKYKKNGYTKRDIVGKNGIEKEYELDLQGKRGYEYIEVNALNRVVKQIETKESKAGSDIYLTIDIRLQQYMTDYFKENNYKGAFIALNPKNGEIITMVSYPEYSLNMFASKFSAKKWNEIINGGGNPLQDRGHKRIVSAWIYI